MTILDQLEAAEKAATRGPWDVRRSAYGAAFANGTVAELQSIDGLLYSIGTLVDVTRQFPSWHADQDAALIALLRNYAADLIRVARAVEKLDYFAMEKAGAVGWELEEAMVPLLASGDES